jgi:hypothetical protein
VRQAQEGVAMAPVRRVGAAGGVTLIVNPNRRDKH